MEAFAAAFEAQRQAWQQQQRQQQQRQRLAPHQPQQQDQAPQQPQQQQQPPQADSLASGVDATRRQLFSASSQLEQKVTLSSSPPGANVAPTHPQMDHRAVRASPTPPP